ncbi:type VI secretion system protein ImpH [Desulfonauticus submarinus]|uniref:Type VI secretion system protein ImpH n=1 Tax=Desulfonauticus submarinus TaxID=206665 RepID=A0A1G9ZTV0_9BACT|nr:type VI secretion system baseplate subunit TssG [Desulfonauticus submarinus]SDN24829.1 type VI secretion system protein ImpH [Desulfonauticus submarinus]
MSSQIWGTAINLKQELEQHSSSFNFVQAIRLLRVLLDKNKSLDRILEEDVFVEPLLSLAFPGSDIYKIEKRDDKYHVLATFLGLYGPSSPLPVYYTEEIINERLEEKSVKKDFLDIFNHPFYELFIKIWLKYRIWLKIIDEKDEESLNFIYAFLGLDYLEIESKEKRNFLRYAALFCQRPRSAIGIKAIVSDFLNEDKVEIRQCVEVQVEIPVQQRVALGKENTVLGEDLFLGKKVSSRNLAVEIKAGPLKKDAFKKIVPVNNNFKRLQHYLRLYMELPLQCNFIPVLKSSDASPLSLGKEWCFLGVNSWIYTKDKYKDNLVGLWKI